MDATGNSRVAPIISGKNPLADLAPGNALVAGMRLREFEIVETLGEGGFSIVYGARDLQLMREVAIKEYIPISLAGRVATTTVRIRSEHNRETFEAGLVGFINEARLLAQFKHPGLVEVLQFWEENGTAYMVMPRYTGKTLRSVLKEMGGRGDEPWLRGIVAPVLDVLELLHSRNVFHRDIAPDNILIKNDGTPVLLDLGSAREVVTGLQKAITVVVKPGYAPIEQYSSDFALPQGPWTDVYAVGALLHFALIGSPPPASISRIMKDNLQPLAAAGLSGYSREFLTAVDKALMLQPGDRPQSIGELRELLRVTENDRTIISLVSEAEPEPLALDSILDAMPPDPASAPLPAAPAMLPIPAARADGEDERTVIVSAQEVAALVQQLAGAKAAAAAAAAAAAQSKAEAAVVAVVAEVPAVAEMLAVPAATAPVEPAPAEPLQQPALAAAPVAVPLFATPAPSAPPPFAPAAELPREFAELAPAIPASPAFATPAVAVPQPPAFAEPVASVSPAFAEPVATAYAEPVAAASLPPAFAESATAALLPPAFAEPMLAAPTAGAPLFAEPAIQPVPAEASFAAPLAGVPTVAATLTAPQQVPPSFELPAAASSGVGLSVPPPFELALEPMVVREPPPAAAEPVVVSEFRLPPEVIVAPPPVAPPAAAPAAVLPPAPSTADSDATVVMTAPRALLDAAQAAQTPPRDTRPSSPPPREVPAARTPPRAEPPRPVAAKPAPANDATVVMAAPDALALARSLSAATPPPAAANANDATLVMPLPAAPPVANAVDLDPLAAPVKREKVETNSFPEMEDLLSGRLTSETRPVSVPAQQPRSSRGDVPAPSVVAAAAQQGGAGKPWLVPVAIVGAVLTVGVAAWWLLSGPSEVPPPPPLVAETPAVTPPVSETATAPVVTPGAENPVVAANPGDTPATGGEVAALPASTDAANPVVPPVDGAAVADPNTLAATPADSGQVLAPISQPSEATSTALEGQGQTLPLTPPEHAQPIAATPPPAAAPPAAATTPPPGDTVKTVDLTPTTAPRSEDPINRQRDTASTTRNKRDVKPAMATTGNVKLGIQPWGEVWINGSLKGVSPPMRFLQLEPGTYNVELRNPGLQSVRRQLTVVAGQPTTLEHRFQPAGESAAK
ncbi:serine/threonine protein kinase [Tahibacter aquaticus]|uniref:Serine/threonine protein kinase n=1 Tax=Tahibacter aquaticus TaxID=520092 RepID=A0A4R6Z7U9_9GAMM|nr:serine/threonine-protein kinase [Tahibacter aquaticus]TDR47865.1 serine/threonine protein kinase [Tahibacter aquaticus]